MNYVKHSNLEGKHAPFSPSQPSWLRYNDEKMITAFRNKQASFVGTKKHEWAKMSIDLGIRMPDEEKTLYMYVNDGIGYKMDTEILLYYSDRFFGTADTISFRDNFLRIHDLKTGVAPIHMDQLKIYAALFCLEYKVKPHTISIELRIYQNDMVDIIVPDPEEILYIMDEIVHKNKLIENVDKMGV